MPRLLHTVLSNGPECTLYRSVSALQELKFFNKLFSQNSKVVVMPLTPPHTHTQMQCEESASFVFFCRYKLIRRRVIWLIGQWISVKFKSDLRPVLYEIILSLMQDPDLVVRHLQTVSLSPTLKSFFIIIWLLIH